MEAEAKARQEEAEKARGFDKYLDNTGEEAKKDIAEGHQLMDSIMGDETAHRKRGVDETKSDDEF